MNTINKSGIFVCALMLVLSGMNADAQTLFEPDYTRSTSATSSVSSEQMRRTPASNLTNTLFGRLQGLSVMEGSGQIGKDMALMTIRGAGTFNSSEGYTVYVDGFETDPSFIEYMNPSEIYRIYILKDAAALSTLGMKGSNGALYIVTKRGNEGKLKIDFNTTTGWQMPKTINRPLGASAYERYYNEAISNDGGMNWSPVYTSSPTFDTDWYSETLKKTTPFHSTDFSISGGNRFVRAFTSLAYVRNNGLYNVKNDDIHSNSKMNQYSMRTNIDFDIFDIFEGKVDVGGRISDNSAPNYSEDKLWYNMATYPANIYGVFDGGVESNDTWAGTATHPDNPVASIRGLGFQTKKDRTFMANISLKEKLDFITPGLYVEESASFASWVRGTYKMTRNYSRMMGGVPQTADVNSSYTPSDDKGTNQWMWNQFRVQVGYDRSFGKNDITAAFAYEQYHRNVDSNMNGNAGVQTQYAHQAVNGKINYSFDKRYVAEFGFSYCGSDNYAKGNRFRFYPSVSVAWNINNEKFMKDVEAINRLKLRASTGTSGYDLYNGGRYLYSMYYVAGNSFPTNNSSSPTFNPSLVPAFLPDESLTSETSFKSNIGIDAGFLDCLDITIDAFLEKRSGIVTKDNKYPSAIGLNPPYRNVGATTTKGIELSAGYSQSFGNFSLSLKGMASILDDRIDEMAEIAPASPSAALTGRNIGAIIGYRFDGFYDISDFDESGNLLSSLSQPSFGTVQPGDVKYKDLNGDSIIDERDRTFLGKGSFPYRYYSALLSLSYKGFDFSCLFQGVGGRQVNLLDAGSKVIAFRNNSTIYPIAENRWAYYPAEGIDTRKEATYPRLSTTSGTNNYLTSDLWLRSGNFLTLRNLEIGYSLPKKVCSRIKLQTVRFYMNGINLLTFSPLSKETGMDAERMTGYPAIKSVNIGLNLGF